MFPRPGLTSFFVADEGPKHVIHIVAYPRGYKDRALGWIQGQSLRLDTRTEPESPTRNADLP